MFSVFSSLSGIMSAMACAAAIFMPSVTREARASSDTAEQTRKDQNVVHLIGIVAAARADHRCTCRLCFFRENFRRGIGTGENDGIVVHAPNHLCGQAMGNAGADKDIRTLHCIGKTACYFARVGDLGKLLLVACQTRGAARDQNAVFIHSDNILDAHAHQHLDDGRTCGTGTILHNADGLHFLPVSFSALIKAALTTIAVPC